MIDTDTAKTVPPWSSAVLTAAAIGTLIAVASRNRIRMGRPLPEMALADQVNWVHGSQSSPKTRACFPTPAQVGSTIN